MAGFFPDNKEITLYGEDVLYPGVDAKGEYTGGDFGDPHKPPSRLDFETMNLILKNLNSLITSMGLKPNNTGGEQLAALFSVAAEANKGIKRDKDGRAQVASPKEANDIARKAEVDAEAKARKDADSGLSSRISSNSSSMSSLGSRISSNDTDISNLSSRVSTTETNISRLQQYRSYETPTGMTWKNGQAIYRRCWSGITVNMKTIFNIGTGKNSITQRQVVIGSSGDWEQNFTSNQTDTSSTLYHNSTTGNVMTSVAGRFVGKSGNVVIEYY